MSIKLEHPRTEIYNLLGILEEKLTEELNIAINYTNPQSKSHIDKTKRNLIAVKVIRHNIETKHIVITEEKTIIT